MLRWGEGCSGSRGPQAGRPRARPARPERTGRTCGRLQLSGGEKQRVAIGRALVKDPRSSSPTSRPAALDWENGQQVIELLDRNGPEGGATVLVVTHDPRLLPLRRPRVRTGRRQADRHGLRHAEPKRVRAPGLPAALSNVQPPLVHAQPQHTPHASHRPCPTCRTTIGPRREPERSLRPIRELLNRRTAVVSRPVKSEMITGPRQRGPVFCCTSAFP